jgi:predicted XRE-type DNA-binding protein
MLKPTKGDWFNTIKEDFQLINEDIANFDEQKIKTMQLKAYKRFIRKKIRQAAFEYLEADKGQKSKVMDISYKKFSIQKYVTSTKFTDEEVYLLSRLRSRNILVKDNFSGMFTDTICSLGCLERETQQHILECKPLVEKSNLRTVLQSMQYSDIFGSEKRQKIAILVFAELLKIRDELLNV